MEALGQPLRPDNALLLLETDLPTVVFEATFGGTLETPNRDG